MKKDRATTSDEQRERMLIAEQIERAANEAGPSGSPSDSPPPVEEGLKRDEGAEKLVLSFAPKPSATATSAPTLSTGFKLNPLKPAVNPLKANPLKRPNVFKTASSSAATAESDKGNDKKRTASAMSAAERLIIEEQERKRRRMDRESM